MSRNLWGKLDRENCDEIREIRCASIKYPKSEGIKALRGRKSVLKIKNAFICQTIEVKKQSEMLHSLIDTYSTKSGPSNYLLQPCQIIPEVDFPVENAANFVTCKSFTKSSWVISALDSRFARGIPEHYCNLNIEICKVSMRKAASGQLNVAGFTDVVDSALYFFSDAIEEFIKNLIACTREAYIKSKEPEIHPLISIDSLAKVYLSLKSDSLMTLFNYWKTLLKRNHSEIVAYKGVFEDYERLMKASRNLQREKFRDVDYISVSQLPTVEDSSVTRYPE